MTSNFSTAMRRAMELTRASDVLGATRAIQQALAGGEPAKAPDTPQDLPKITAADGASSAKPSFAARAYKPLSEVIEILKQGRATVLDVPAARTPPVSVPDGAQFTARALPLELGGRHYKLYVPKSRAVPLRGLVIMLHGCSQNPDDFAIGTGMNEIAEAENFLVAYPKQDASSNAGSCWNWFVPAHQLRDRGEPASIAAITRALIAEFEVPASNVFVAGLSAGGAMAAIMAETYPELYAAAGIHSGLAYGSANDVMSAFAAMRGDKSMIRRAPGPQAHTVRTIVFQGTADSTVHPSNMDAVVDSRVHASWHSSSGQHKGAKSRPVDHQVFRSPAGEAMLEVWKIIGAGHAWAGGRAPGSFTDPNGPDASAEMIRFFFRPEADA